MLIIDSKAKISRNLSKFLSLFVILQIIFASFISPAAATSNTENNKSPPSLDESTNWFDTGVLGLLDYKATNDGQRVDTDGDGIVDARDWDSDNDCIPDKVDDTNDCDGRETTTSGGCNPGSKTDTGDNGTDHTTTVRETDSGTDGKTTSTTSTTHSTATETSSESTTETTQTKIPGTSSETSQKSEFRSNLPGSGVLPDVNSPVVAVIGLLCVVGGLFALTRR